MPHGNPISRDPQCTRVGRSRGLPLPVASGRPDEAGAELDGQLRLCVTRRDGASGGLVLDHSMFVRGWNYVGIVWMGLGSCECRICSQRKVYGKSCEPLANWTVCRKPVLCKATCLRYRNLEGMGFEQSQTHSNASILHASHDIQPT